LAFLFVIGGLMKLKYSAQLQLIEKDNKGSCTAMCTPIEATAYHLIFIAPNPKISENFLPRAVTPNPQQELRKKQCEGWALSLFDTETNAANFMAERCNDKKNLYKYLGTHLAAVKVEKEDGVGAEVEGNGHFNFHESAKVDFSTKVTGVTQLYP